jgi:hypothetical protein
LDPADAMPTTATVIIAVDIKTPANVMPVLFPKSSDVFGVDVDAEVELEAMLCCCPFKKCLVRFIYTSFTFPRFTFHLSLW